jgi:hypothetical protein
MRGVLQRKTPEVIVARGNDLDPLYHPCNLEITILAEILQSKKPEWIQDDGIRATASQAKMILIVCRLIVIYSRK